MTVSGQSLPFSGAGTLGVGMADTVQKSDESYSEAETVARREAALKRMLATPPKPHTAIKGKRKVQRGSD